MTSMFYGDLRNACSAGKSCSSCIFLSLIVVPMQAIIMKKCRVLVARTCSYKLHCVLYG